jgi:hypothetical protein
MAVFCLVRGRTQNRPKLRYDGSVRSLVLEIPSIIQLPSNRSGRGFLNPLVDAGGRLLDA